jgi:hypothetical protein
MKLRSYSEYLIDFRGENCNDPKRSMSQNPTQLSLVDVTALKEQLRGEILAELKEKESAPLTVEEFAHKNRLDRQHVYKLCQRGKIPGAKKFGALWRIYS